MIDSAKEMWKTVINLIDAGFEWLIWFAQFIAFAACVSILLDLIF